MENECSIRMPPILRNPTDVEEIRRRASEIPIRPYGRLRLPPTHTMGVCVNQVAAQTHCYAPYGRMQPYYIPHRTRTKSESSEQDHFLMLRETPARGGTSTVTTNATLSSTLMETCEPVAGASADFSMNACGTGTFRSSHPALGLLGKSRSLENVQVDNSLEGSQHSHEMEFVSCHIQKLKVQE